MNISPYCRKWSLVIAVSLLSACVTPPTTPTENQQPSLTVNVNETAMLPLLSYFQQLQHMSPQDLARERNMLTALPQTPTTNFRLAMLLGQARGQMDLGRAQGLLEGLLKSNTPEAVSLYPLVRALSNQYQERLKLEAQNEKLTQQLKESQRRGDELQEKLNAMADIEHSISVRPTTRKSSHGMPQ